MTAICAYCRQEYPSIGAGPKDHDWIACGERMSADARRLRQPFRNADEHDWKRLNDMLGFSAHGRFWRAVFEDFREALDQKA